MQNAIEFLTKNFKIILMIGGVCVTFYVQSVTNTKTIGDLQEKTVYFEKKLSQQDEQINDLKIDRAAYKSTVEQVSLIREDIKELRSDVKELLKKR